MCLSTSWTGVHILCRGSLPEGVQTITDDLPDADGFPDAEIEVYDSARFVAMTGQHIEGTPGETRGCQSFIETLATEYATVTANRPDGMRDDPPKTRAELADIDTTTDIQDVYDAIRQMRPADIRLRSTVTEERSDGSQSLDPCWTHSTSGTRLAQVDDGWIYRDGMISLDALQVVALEEGIVANERAYPEGAAFWEAVEMLRERGAHVPEYESNQGAESGGADIASPSIDPEDRAGAEAPDPALAHETELLRETVTDQRARIDELETVLEEQEATIEKLRAQLEQREAELAALRDAGAAVDDSEGSGRRPSSSPLVRVQRWFADRLNDSGRIGRRNTGD